MSTGIFFLIEALIYMILLLFIYFNKKRFKSEENKIYTFLMLTSLTELLLELILDYVGPMYETIPLISYLIARLYCIFLQLWITTLCLYIVIITLNMNKLEKYKKNIKYIFSIILLVFSFLIFKLPINFYYNGEINYTYGPSVNIVYISSMIFTFVGIICLFCSKKNIKDKRFLPLMMFIIVGGLCSYLQYKNPGLLLAVPVHAFITFLMYFTIENPDMKLLKEMHKAKEISDNANEEKTMFLYNMTQEIRNTTDKINDEADIILDSDSLEQDKDSARNIKGETAKFRSTVNDIMDVSVIDTSSIKIYNSKYNIKNLLKEIVSMYNGVCMNKGLEFRTNIEHDIPELLYGDSIGLKKSIMNILNTSIKNTLKGYIEFNVNTIKKNDICRLIITIEDSGIGIKSSELEKIKIDNKNISLAYKLITLMNGTMVISSDYGIGSKIKIVLDQRVVDNISRKEKQYNEVYNNKKILIVDDSEAGIKIIEKLLKGSNIIIDKAFTGRECLDKIRSKNKYDVILLDEELSQIKGYELLIKLKEIRSFNIPVILLSKDNSYEYNEEYKKLGFSGILIKPIKKEILITNIDKFMKK